MKNHMEDVLNAWKHTAAWNYLDAVSDADSASQEWRGEQGVVKFLGGTRGRQLWGDSSPPFTKSAAASSVYSAAFISKHCSYLEEGWTVACSLHQWQAVLTSNLEGDHLDLYLPLQDLYKGGWKMCI